MNSTGPTRITIPSRSRLECGRCEYHKCTGALHVRSGPGGWREYSCMHPDAYEPIPEESLAKLTPELRAVMEQHRIEGRSIGRTEATPNWCPFLREKD